MHCECLGSEGVEKSEEDAPALRSREKIEREGSGWKSGYRQRISAPTIGLVPGA